MTDKTSVEVAKNPIHNDLDQDHTELDRATYTGQWERAEYEQGYRFRNIAFYAMLMFDALSIGIWLYVLFCRQPPANTTGSSTANARHLLQTTLPELTNHR